MDSTLQPKSYTGIQFVGIPEFPAIGHQVGLHMVKVIQGKMSIDEALQKSLELVDNLMKKRDNLKSPRSVSENCNLGSVRGIDT